MRGTAWLAGLFLTAPSCPPRRPRRRRPRRPRRTRRGGAGASSRSGTISRRWVRAWGWQPPPSPARGQRCTRSPESVWPVQGMDGRAGWRVTGPSALTGQQQIKVKVAKPPAKVQIPRGEEPEEEEPGAGGREMGVGAQGPGSPGSAVLHWASRASSSAAPSPPPARVVKKPPAPAPAPGGANAIRKAEAEPARKAKPAQEPEPGPEPEPEPERRPGLQSWVPV